MRAFLQSHAVMRESLETPRYIDLSQRDKGMRRRLSLRRGIDTWMTALSASDIDVQGAFTGLLTFQSGDPAVWRNAIRQWWWEFREAYGTRPYFSWAELTARGRVHYHFIVINPPWKNHAHYVRYRRRHWLHGPWIPDDKFRTADWVFRSGGKYVRKYARAPNKFRPAGAPPVIRGDEHQVDKSYQQDYNHMPREIRTYQHSLLPWPVDVVRQHMDRAECISTEEPWASWELRSRSWYVVAVDHHTPEAGCRTLAHTRRRPRTVMHRGRLTRRGGRVVAASPVRP